MQVLYEMDDARHRSRSASRVIALIGLTVACTPTKQIARKRHFLVHPIVLYVPTRRHRDTDMAKEDFRLEFHAENLRARFACDASESLTFCLNLYVFQPFAVDFF